jgi:hypothetical protein
MHNGPNIITDGLVLALDAANTKSYPGSGTVWKDMSGNVNNGTLLNGVGYSGDNLGSLVFDGVNDFVALGNISSLILSNNQFTVNYWLQITGSARGDFFSIKNFNTPTDDIGFFIDTNNKLYAFFNVQGTVTNNGGITGSRASISNTTFSRNIIYNITCMKDASQKIVMYVNGVLDNNIYSTITNTANVVSTNLWIGSNRTNATTPTLGWQGNIYSTQIYNRALNATEVAQNYNATKGRYGL